MHGHFNILLLPSIFSHGSSAWAEDKSIHIIFGPLCNGQIVSPCYDNCQSYFKTNWTAKMFYLQKLKMTNFMAGMHKRVRPGLKLNLV